MRNHLAAARRHSSRTSGRRAAAILALLVAGQPVAGLARTIKLPEAQPVVMFDIPDDWTMTPADAGLAFSAPDRTSVIVTGVVKRSKTDVAAWQKKATQRMVDFGIKFDPSAKPPRKPSNNGLGVLVRPQNAPPSSPAGGSSAPSSAPSSGPSSVPSLALLDQLPGAPPPPSLNDLPDGNYTADKDATGKDAAGKAAAGKEVAGKNEVGKQAGKPAEAPPPMRFSSAVLYGAALAGKPVDVQFLNYVVNKETAFVMQQESGPTDDRAAAVIKSVRAVN